MAAATRLRDSLGLRLLDAGPRAPPGAAALSVSGDAGHTLLVLSEAGRPANGPESGPNGALRAISLAAPGAARRARAGAAPCRALPRGGAELSLSGGADGNGSNGVDGNGSNGVLLRLLDADPQAACPPWEQLPSAP
jgi:hypothetical protein